MKNVALSKTIAYVLRHDPAAYDLVPDADGWVLIADLTGVLRSADRRWADLEPEDVVALVETAAESGGKRRYEIDGTRIRATYGHSTPTKVRQVPAPPPPVLFHGTPPERLAAILVDGLRPMRRQYVHLSPELATARTVGGRRSRRPAVLQVDASAAHASGVRFYPTNDPGTWLSDAVAGRYLSRLE